MLCKLALFLNLKEEPVASQCINQLYKSSKVGYVRAATLTKPFRIFPVYNKKLSSISFFILNHKYEGHQEDEKDEI